VKFALVTTLERGGPVEHARVLAGALTGSGVMVRAVVTTDELGERFATCGAEVVVVGSASTRRVEAVAAVHRSCRGYDIVHSHDRRSALWVLGPSRPHGSAVRVHTLHGLPEPYLPIPGNPSAVRSRDRLAYRIVEPWLVRRADAVIVPSRAAAKLAIDLGHPAETMVVVAHGVDVDDRPASGSRIGLIGALEPVKGVDVFVRTAALLAERDPSLRFAVFGTGPELTSLRALAAQLGLGDALVFAGHVPASSALDDVRVLVVSSHYETSSLAMLEAMARGVPVVATNVGGIPEQVADGAVCLVPPNDATALADAIRMCIDDAASAAARAERARQYVRRSRSIRAMGDAVIGVYERALARTAAT